MSVGATRAGSDARWRLVASHHDMLVRIARARGAGQEDAEDAAQEAMLRASQFANLDSRRVEAWLTAVTQRLVIDQQRRHARAERLAPRTVDALATPSHEEDICNLELARWARRAAEELGHREREVLLARAAGRSGPQTAYDLGISYKAMEAAFFRARRKMDGLVRSALAVFVLLVHRVKRPALTAVPVTVALAAVILGAHRPPSSPVPQPLGPIRVVPADRAVPPRITDRRDVVAQTSDADRAAGVGRHDKSNDTQEVVRAPAVVIGPAHASEVRAGYEHQEESFEQTLARCLSEGVEISSQRIACREHPEG